MNYYQSILPNGLNIQKLILCIRRMKNLASLTAGQHFQSKSKNKSNSILAKEQLGFRKVISADKALQKFLDETLYF